MDTISLAVVSEQTLLSASLTHLRSGTRALVVRYKDRPPLLWTAAELLQAQNEALDNHVELDKVTLATIKPVHRPVIAPGYAHLAPKAGLFESMLGAGQPPDLQRYRDLFGQTDNRYAIHELTEHSALVVTASEEFAVNLAGTLVICSCDGSPTHRFERWQIINFPACNKPHTATVTCSTLSDAS